MQETIMNFIWLEMLATVLPWLIAYFAINVIIMILISIGAEYNRNEKIKYIFFGLPFVIISVCLGVFLGVVIGISMRRGSS